jgi:hypothetical protein
VLVLLLLILVVVGFALGGSLRAALASTQSGSDRPAPLADERVPVAQVAADTLREGRDGAPGARAGTNGYATHPARLPIGSQSRVGKALPSQSGHGRRIIYQESSMHLWVVEADGTVARDYPVTGRPGWPRPATYHVFSKALAAASPRYHVTFDWMLRFAHGNDLNIGFHDIPRVMGTGVPIQEAADLGAPIGHGGCVRQRTVDAKWLYGWATVGTTVVVLR